MMSNKTNIGIGSVAVILVAAYLGLDLNQQKSETVSPDVHQPSVQVPQKQLPQQYDEAKRQNVEPSQDNRIQEDVRVIQQAYKSKLSNIQVQAAGHVKAILRDDNNGSRHQKFILDLGHGQTVLVAHNIDLSPRLQNLQKGEIVQFYGEYEYSHQGGVIHWTHHDPQQKHADGWLKYNGRTYQ